VSRFLSDGTTPCPYLQPGSFLRVYSRPFSSTSVSATNFGLAALPLLVGSSSSSSDVICSSVPLDRDFSSAPFLLVETDFFY
jgi:hypothetical protein